MATGILHTHITAVIIFLLLFSFKTTVLLLGNYTFLDLLRRRTKVIEMIFGTLILLSGGYLLFKGGHPANWLMVKFVLVLILIPAGIFALRKGNKGLAIVSLLGFIYIFGVSETRSLTLSKPKYGTSEVKGDKRFERAQAIYNVECVRCHGTYGNEMSLGAKDLTISKISEESARVIIAEGKGVMPAFKEKLTNDEMDILAAYLQTFKDRN
ncbi:MAG: SirB2 family protein [Bacteroidota bacterium]